MQFFFLLLFNIFLGAVLYLVISLKLERSATEYRSRKLRKEMDEMISEFNATAERNISLLERKIRVMRLLLEKAGELKSLDLTACEEEDSAQKEAGAAEPRAEAAPRAVPAGRTEPVAVPASYPAEGNNAGSFIKKGLLIFVEKINTMLQTGRAGVPAGGEYVDRQLPAAADDAFTDPGADPRRLIEKDLSGVVPEADAAGAGPGPAISEDEIREIIESSPDMYAVVSVLSKRGCAAEEISRYSGIPVGEVRLVMNLDGSR